MAKKRVGKFPRAFRQMAVDRLTQCDNIVELAKELGISRRLLYTWCDQLDPVERSEGPPANARESTLRKEVSQLKRLLAEKMLEVDFSKGPGSRFRTSRRDPHGLGQAERLRKFPRRLGQFPPSFLAEPRRVPSPPVTYAPGSPPRQQETQNVPVFCHNSRLRLPPWTIPP